MSDVEDPTAADLRGPTATPHHVLVTGACGAIGTAVSRALRAHGHRVIGLDVPAAEGRAEFRGDATDPGVVAPAMAELVHRADGRPTAVVHLAAIPSPTGPGHRVFTNNTAASFTVLESAGMAGVGAVVLASSISALGFAFGRDSLQPLYLPIDEEHPSSAEDAYALSKLTDELTAAMMHRRWGTGVLALRLPFVGDGARLQSRIDQAAADPGSLRTDLWGYLHTDDAARAFGLAVEARWKGCDVMTVAAPDTVCDQPTRQLVEQWLPGVRLRRDLPGHTGLHDLNRAETLLGFRAGYRWREALDTDTDTSRQAPR